MLSYRSSSSIVDYDFSSPLDKFCVDFMPIA